MSKNGKNGNNNRPKLAKNGQNGPKIAKIVTKRPITWPIGQVIYRIIPPAREARAAREAPGGFNILRTLPRRPNTHAHARYHRGQKKLTFGL